ncbi:MAG TPA: hypothetical protein VGE59_00445 [Patescibacteria group bacterium]
MAVVGTSNSAQAPAEKQPLPGLLGNMAGHDEEFVSSAAQVTVGPVKIVGSDVYFDGMPIRGERITEASLTAKPEGELRKMLPEQLVLLLVTLLFDEDGNELASAYALRVEYQQYEFLIIEKSKPEEQAASLQGVLLRFELGGLRDYALTRELRARQSRIEHGDAIYEAYQEMSH